MTRVRVIDRRPLYVRVGTPGPPGPPIQGAVEAVQFVLDPAFIPTGEGYIFWDKFTKMMAGKSDIPGTTLNFGLEDWTRVRNETGDPLLDGTAVFGADVIDSPITGEPTFLVVPALAAPDQQIGIPGILTSDIADGAEGWAVTRGEVKSYDTSGFSKLDFLFLSGTVGLEGFLTNIPPSPPNYPIPIGYAKDSAVDGHVYVFTSNPSPIVAAVDAAWASGDPTGFHDGDNIGEVYDPIARTMTLTHASGKLKYTWRGQVTELDSPWVSPVHDDVLDTGFFLYSVDGMNFVWSDSSWDFDDVQAAFAWYGTIDKFGIREPHGLMPWQNHKQEHQTTGTYRESGGDVGGYVLGSTVAAERRPTVSATRVKDEDSTTVLPLLNNSLYTRGYLTGAGILTFAKDSADTNIFNGNIPYWNEFDGNDWIQSAVAQNQYVSIWLVAVPVTEDNGSQSYRYLWIQGQSSGTLTDQLNDTPASLALGNFQTLFTEFVFIEQQIQRYQAGNWHIAESIVLTGTRNQQVGSPAGNYLSAVSHDETLGGGGTPSDLLTVKGLVKNHETIGGPINISPVEGTEHIGDFSVGFTATLAGFTEAKSSIVFLLEKTGAGTATVSLAVGTGTIIFIGANNLTDLEANTYMFVVQLFAFPDPADNIYVITVGIKP